MTHSQDHNERDLFGRDPDPLTAAEWLMILSFTTGALGIIGGLIYLCLLIVRG